MSITQLLARARNPSIDRSSPMLFNGALNFNFGFVTGRWALPPLIFDLED
jgi:hypothetical protein